MAIPLWIWLGNALLRRQLGYIRRSWVHPRSVISEEWVFSHHQGVKRGTLDHKRHEVHQSWLHCLQCKYQPLLHCQVSNGHQILYLATQWHVITCVFYAMSSPWSDIFFNGRRYLAHMNADMRKTTTWQWMSCYVHRFLVHKRELMQFCPLSDNIHLSKQNCHYFIHIVGQQSVW